MTDPASSAAPPTDAERQAAREYALRWKRLGPELEVIRRRELRNSDPERNRVLADALLRMAAAHAKPRPTSGLIHLERLLGRLHDRRSV